MKYSFGFIVAGIIIFCLILSGITFAQNEVVYDFVDTLKISEAQNSPVYVFKMDTTYYSESKYDHRIITKIKVYDIFDRRLIQTIQDTSEFHMNGGSIYFEDMNLDGFRDIVIDLGCYSLSSKYSFWIFNETKNEFFPSLSFNQLNDYTIDKETKIIHSVFQFVGGRGGSIDDYKIIGDSLILWNAEFSNWLDYAKSEYINGQLRIVRKRKSYEVSDSTDYILRLDNYSFVEDTLLLINSDWVKNIGPDVPENLIKNKIAFCEPPFGCFKYFKKQEYNYTLIDNELIADTTYYIVENDKWIKQK